MSKTKSVRVGDKIRGIFVFGFFFLVPSCQQKFKLNYIFNFVYHFVFNFAMRFAVKFVINCSLNYILSRSSSLSWTLFLTCLYNFVFNFIHQLCQRDDANIVSRLLYMEFPYSSYDWGVKLTKVIDRGSRRAYSIHRACPEGTRTHSLLLDRNYPLSYTIINN